MKWFVNGGHGPKNSGGFDPGAVGPTGLKEADITNLFDDIFAYCMNQQGEQIVRVMEDGDLSDITGAANSSGADFFISFHCNSAADSSAHGYEVYALSPGGKGEQLAKYIDAELGVTGLTNRGVKFANYYVLKNTKMPAVLVELAFISNPGEEALLKQREKLEVFAKAVTKGCLKMAGKTYNEPQPQPAPTPIPTPPPAPIVDTEKDALRKENADLKAKLDAIRKVVM